MVDITPQEEVPQEETPREEMVAPIDNALAEKIYKTIEDHSEVLKKMGSHLSKLEESKLKNGMRGKRLIMKGINNLRSLPRKP